jgi:hypothetical protein
MGGFQTQVNLLQAPAVEGDFASANPRSTVLAGPGGLVAGQFGATVGRFGWVDPDMRTVNSFASSNVAPDGFLHRNMQALITIYLAAASLLVPEGFALALFNGGDFWVKNQGPAALTKGATVYAGFTDGGAYSSAPSGAAATGSIGSTNTAAIGSTSTGTVVADNPNQITLSGVTGVVSVGDSITGVGVPENTEITAQISGTAGGAGVYETSNQTTAAAATITTFGTVLVVSATTGLISEGDTVSGSAGFPVGATVVSQLAGGTPGGAGSYILSAPATEYIASATGVTTFGSVLKVSAVGSGTLLPGMPISGTNMPATSISAQISGTTGGAGVYNLFAPATQYVASESFTTAGGIDSGWKAYPTNTGDGAVGSLVKISHAVV